MSDPLLPAGITVKGGVAVDGSPAVCIDLGKRQLAFGECTISIVLPPRQMRALCALGLKAADQAEGRRLYLVGEDDGA